jgi:hypothetical protein
MDFVSLPGGSAVTSLKIGNKYISVLEKSYVLFELVTELLAYFKKNGSRLIISPVSLCFCLSLCLYVCLCVPH